MPEPADNVHADNLARDLRTIAVGVAHHHLCNEAYQDDDGFWIVVCGCGERLEPVPDVDEAFDLFAAHVGTAILGAVHEVGLCAD